MLASSLFVLLHVLVFVYWLGGDLGAFYASRYLTMPGVSADRRMLAAKVVGDVDMAPRTALILTLPTGLAAAQAKGWLDVGWSVIGGVGIASLAWLAVAWRLHAAHGSAPPLAAIDTALRWTVLATGIAAAGATAVDLLAVPAFVAIKLAILSLCILMGLLIRRVLKPLGSALGDLSSPGQSAEGEARLAKTIRRARPLVVIIWALLVTAAFLGLTTPMTFEELKP